MKDRMTFEDELVRYGRFVYTNQGRSMMPMLRENRDLLIVESIPQNDNSMKMRCHKFDVVLYKRGERYIIHRILKVLPDGYIICGDNNWRREYDIDDTKILGKLTAFVRDGTEISVTDRKYMLYVHLWCDFYHVRAAVLWIRSVLSRIKRKIRRKR